VRDLPGDVVRGDRRSQAAARYQHGGRVVDKGQTRVKPELWWRVYDRDNRQCILRELIPDISPCTDKWGSPVKVTRNGTRPLDLTCAHIKRPPDYLRRTDEAHLTMVCWGHHVFGEMSATSKPVLEKVRDYLERLYPDA
jgi:hypothetical protein